VVSLAGSAVREKKKLGAYLTDSTVTNYNTLNRLHIAQKFSKDTIGAILHNGHEQWEERGMIRKRKRVRLKMMACGERRVILTILWAKDERKDGAEGGGEGEVVQLES
jgi:hypothetical protein